MGLFSFKKPESNVPWVHLENVDQLDQIKKDSFDKPVLILKHSSRCSISAMALRRLESKWEMDADSITAYYLDLLRHRDISNKIESEFNVMHQSPQALLIKNGECVYTTTHSNIDARSIKNEL